MRRREEGADRCQCGGKKTERFIVHMNTPHRDGSSGGTGGAQAPYRRKLYFMDVKSTKELGDETCAFASNINSTRDETVLLPQFHLSTVISSPNPPIRLEGHLPLHRLPLSPPRRPRRFVSLSTLRRSPHPRLRSPVPPHPPPRFNRNRMGKEPQPISSPAKHQIAAF
jgi:hypothetical protein